MEDINFVSNKLHSLVAVLALSIGTLHGQNFDQAARSFNEQDEKIQQFNFEQEEIAAEVLPNFFEFKTEYDTTGNARIYSPPYEGGTVRYSDLEFDAYYTHAFGCSSGISIGAGWCANEIHWRSNPFFNRTQFNNAIFSLTGFTGAIPRWLWKGGFSTQVDTHTWDWSNYAIYNLTIWGRYSYWDNLGIHTGLLGQTGIRKDKVLPILGFDLTWWDNWQLNMIYPVNMSLVYNIDDAWSVLLAARIMEARYRLGKEEPLSKGIWQYQNVGTEVGLTYQCGAFAYANFHVGCASGGDLKISDFHDHHAIHVKQDATAYVGGSLDIKW